MPNDNTLPESRTGPSDNQRDKNRSLWRKIMCVLEWEDFLSGAVGRDSILFCMLTTVGGVFLSCSLVMIAFVMVVIAAVQLYKMLW